MYLVYIDESGKPNFSDPENFVLSAVIVQELDWKKLDTEIDKLKNKYFPTHAPGTIELHAVELLQGKKFFRGVALVKRHEIAKDIADLISTAPLTLISIIIDKQKVYSHIRTDSWCDTKAWQLMAERLEIFLTKVNYPNIKDHGLITMDSENPIADSIIRDRVRCFRKFGSNLVKSNYLIEDPYFVSSENSNIVQLADFSAWLTRRKYRGNKSSIHETFYDSLFAKIEPRFDSTRKKPNLKLGSGIKFYP